MKIRFTPVLTAAALVMISASLGHASAFLPGDLVVVRLGDGSTALSSAATAGWLDEYTTTGLLVQSIALPTATAGANDALTFTGNSSAEGQVRLSANGQYLSVIGYNATPGTANPSGAAPGTVNRVIGLVGAGGSVDTSTVINNALFTSNPRGVVSDNGSRFWASSGGANGTFYINGATSTQLGTTATRTVGIFGSQLYGSVANTTPGFGLGQIGSGLPTSSASLTLMPGFPAGASTTRSPWGFSMADLNPLVAGLDTLWLADDKVSGGDHPGIQRWTFDGSNWSLSYTLSTGGATTTGARAVTANVVGTVATIYATTTDNRLVKIIDDGSGLGVETDLVTGVANTFMRGVDFAPVAVPEPQSLWILAVGLLVGARFFRRGY